MKWEYQEVSLPSSATLRRLNELGSEGWEAFAVSTETGGIGKIINTVTTVWLKRKVK